MKKISFAAGSSLLAIVLFLSLLPSSLQARVISSEDTIVIRENEIVDDDVFVGGGTVSIKGTVNGDIYVAGGVITVDGTVNGDVLAAGGMVAIGGTVADDVRAAGGNIQIRGAKIGDSVAVAGGTVQIDDETTIGGALVFGSGVITSEAPVTRGVVGGGGSVTLDGPVGRDVKIGADDLVVGPRAAIAGDLVYTSSNKASIDGAAVIAGRVDQIVPQKSAVAGFDRTVRRAFGRIKMAFVVWQYLAALIVGGVLLYIARKPSEAVASHISKRPARSLGVGFLKLVLILPALFLIALTGIGIPLAIIVGLLFVVELYLAKIFVALVLGHWTVRNLELKIDNVYVTFALGLLFYYILVSLPIIKFFAWIMTLLLGLGAIFTYKWELIKGLRK